MFNPIILAEEVPAHLTGTGWATVAVAIFAITYAAVVSEKIHKAVAALIGAVIVIALGIVSQHEAFTVHIDFNVIFLLVGMMVIVHILGKTGVFQWLAIKGAQISKGHPVRILIMLSVLTAIISAFLDNVTTVLLMAPMTLLVAQQLRITPIPYLICEVIASNIGGTATLIGDPPNILIGSFAHLTFNDFLVNLTPCIALVMVGFVIMAKIVFRRAFTTSAEVRARVMEMDASRSITDKRLLVKSLVVMSLVMVAFLLHGMLNLEPATIAIGGAAVLLLITRSDPQEAFNFVEWPTLFFFIGLFVIIGGLRSTGVIKVAADAVFGLTGGSFWITVIVLLWFSAIASAIIDNIPFVATVMFLVKGIAPQIAGNTPALAGKERMVEVVLFWALSLGACLGGNSTIIGASANVVVAGIAERNGHHISFLRFMKYGIPFTIMAMLICTAYIILRYLI
jgi:Na+/H+ antiporter NhaD/arsenite permease-like protein